MDSGNVPPQRSEVVIRGDRNCFYHAFALWRDEISGEKHEEIGRLSSALTEKISEGFSAATLLFQLCEGTCYKEKQDHGHLGIVVHRCLSDRFVPSRRHRKKGFTFKPIMITDSCSSITTKKQRIFLISTSEQHTATDLVNLLCFLRPVPPDHTDLVWEFEKDG